MPYVKTGPFVNGGSPGISSAFLNALETCAYNAISDTHLTNDGNGNLTFSNGNIKRAAGYTEVGKYFVTGWTGAAGEVLGMYYASISRTVTPVSVSIDTSDGAGTGISAPTTNHLTASGVQIYATSSASGVNQSYGGGITIQY